MTGKKKVISTILAVVLVMSLLCCFASSVQALDISDGFEGGIVDKPVIDPSLDSSDGGILAWIINFFKTIINWIMSLFS